MFRPTVRRLIQRQFLVAYDRYSGGGHMRCGSCDAEHPVGARFCMQCGTRIALSCSSCGTSLPEQARFCLSCGSVVEEATAAATPEAPLGAATSTSVETANTPALPESFVGGRYRTVRFLGKGGRKHVYLARDTRLDRDVAVAVIPTDGFDPDAVERVRREARAMARLGDHPHIVAVYDSIEEPGTHIIVSQYMPGGDLSALIQGGESGQLSVERALLIGAQLCAALTHAHTNGVFHRDLKPANVFLGADGLVRLGDFGLARLIDGRDLTLSGSFLGTAAYMPPEQALGGQVDARSDLYALGCLIYDMVAGRPPFTGDDTVGIIGQQINAAPVPPSWHNPAIPRSLDRLVLELLAKSQSDRPPTASVVGERLAAIDIDEPVDPQDRARMPPTGSLVFGRMIGRHDELATLRERIDAAANGQGSLTLLVGEPGIGKTRLSQEAATYAGLRDAVVLWGRCYESEAALAFRPWSEIISQYVRGRRDDELRLELGTGLEDVARIASEVGDRFGSHMAEAGRVEAEADRLRLFDSVVGFLVHAAANRPLLVILDDLHWADTPSLLVMQHLARRLAGSRICVIGTYRDVDLDRQHPLAGVVAELRQRRLYDRIRLHGFDEDELRAMLAVVGQQDEATISTPFLAALLEETEGNPFFVEETLRHLAESGKLVRRGTEWVSDATSISDLDIPEGVREVIGRRLSRLSDPCNTALHSAAVLGREFDFTVLGAMTEMGGDDLLTAVEEALDASVIREFRDRPGVATYQFTHALVQQTLLDELSLPRRQRLHFRAAEALEATSGRATQRQAAVLAGHYRAAGAGGDLDKAVRYTIEAEEAAEATYAWEEAADLFRAATALMDEQGRPEVDVCGYLIDVTLRLGLAAVVPVAEGLAIITRCRAAFRGLPEHRALYELATVNEAGVVSNGYTPEFIDIPRAEGLLDDVHPTDPMAIFWATMIQLNVECMVPRPASLRELADSVPRDQPLGAWAAVYSAIAVWFTGANTEFDASLREAWELSCRSREQLDGFAAHVAAMVDLLDLLAFRRSPRLAKRSFAEEELAIRRQSVPRALDIQIGLAAVARERGDILAPSAVPALADLPAGLTDQGRGFWWMIATREGRWTDALAAHEETLRLFGTGGSHNNAALGAVLAADVQIVRGDLASARFLLEYPLRPATVLHDIVARTRLALVDALAERAEEALAGIEWCRSSMGDEEWGSMPGLLDLAEALARLQMGDHPTAVGCFESALAIARRELHPWDEADAELRWGQSLARYRDAGEALTHFDAALAIYQRIQAGQPWLERVVAARLEALGHSADADAGSSVLLLSRTVRAEGRALSTGGAADVTLVFSDIEGSTALNQRLGDEAWVNVLHAHNDVVERHTQRNGGTIVKSMGDGYMLAFDTPHAALRCAAAIHSDLDVAQPPLEGIRIRIGVHTGTAMSESGDFFGLQVALAARVANAAAGGETLVSKSIWDHVIASGEFGFGAGRAMTFKGISDPQMVYLLER